MNGRHVMVIVLKWEERYTFGALGILNARSGISINCWICS